MTRIHRAGTGNRRDVTRTRHLVVVGFGRSVFAVISDPRFHLAREDLLTNPTEAASVLLKLYELRTEPAMRQARGWFAFEFHPKTTQDVLRVWLGPGHESAPYRMVTSYWDMAASLVTQGAISAAMFNAANTEHFALYAKLQPFLAEIRATTKYPDYLMHVEQVIHSEADPNARVGIFARYMERQRALAADGKQKSYLAQPTAS